MGHSAAHQCQRFIDIKWLGQIIKRTALIGGYGTLQIGMGRHNNDWQLRVHFTHARHQVQPINTRHTNVSYQYIGWCGQQAIKRCLSPLNALNLDIRLRQSTLQHPANCAVIINYCHTCDISHGASPRESGVETRYARAATHIRSSPGGDAKYLEQWTTPARYHQRGPIPWDRTGFPAASLEYRGRYRSWPPRKPGDGALRPG